MKMKILTVFLILASVALPSLGQDIRRDELSSANERLNSTYKQILNRIDLESQEMLRKAQRAWIAYRDLDCASTRRTQVSECFIKRTEERITVLKDTFFEGKASNSATSAHFTASVTNTNFSGRWTIDLRSPQERKQKKDCGQSSFALKQNGDRIVGNHTFATVGCGRLNEGGEETVKGIVIGATAVLVVTSGRNGGMVLGKATRQGDRLYWKTTDELRSGEPEGDSPLILGEGMLLLDSGTH
jgi:type II secretory pathway pseudopilin PulG